MAQEDAAAAQLDAGLGRQRSQPCARALPDAGGGVVVALLREPLVPGIGVAAGAVAEFVETIRTGWWTSCLGNVPARERMRSLVPSA